MRYPLLTAFVLACAGLAGVDAASPNALAGKPAAWDARMAEHLLNRAGFGATGAEIQRAVEIGRDALIEELLAAPSDFEPFYARRHVGAEQRMKMADLDEEERRELGGQQRRKDRLQASEFTAWWVDRMVSADDPLHERMTLFWHGYFTSSQQDVRNSHEMIVQHQLFRDHALGSFRSLLFAIARDPAMLEYLDNDTNRKGNPNENFARELLELFTLARGNYSEEDIKEVARAFTGWTDRGGEFLFRQKLHDDGRKTVLGQTGTFNGDDVLEILLEQEACARHLAGKLLLYFEGVEPSERRVRQYAKLLLRHDYDVGRVLGALFADREFYRDEAVANRIAGPLDYLVGTTRRLGVDPPARLLLGGASLLGQRLLYPPNVKGWDGGRTWITTSSLMQRGNLAGVLVGEVEVADVLGLDREERSRGDGETMSGDEMTPQPPIMEGLGEMRAAQRFAWKPRLHLTWRLEQARARFDHEIVATLVDELLAVPIGPNTRAQLIAFLADERRSVQIDDGELTGHEEAEAILRRLAHVMLSLPEAQLN